MTHNCNCQQCSGHLEPEDRDGYCDCGGVLTQGRWGDWLCDDCGREYGPDEDQGRER